MHEQRGGRVITAGVGAIALLGPLSCAGMGEGGCTGDAGGRTAVQLQCRRRHHQQTLVAAGKAHGKAWHAARESMRGDHTAGECAPDPT